MNIIAASGQKLKKGPVISRSQQRILPMQENAFPGREQVSTPMADLRKAGLPIPKRQNPLAPARVVYCVGDAEKLLRYDILSDRWSFLE